MKKILVPIDFTPASRAASEYAVALAKLFEAQVHLLHVFIEPTPVTEIPTAWMLTGVEWQKENEEQINNEIAYLENAYAIHVTGLATIGYIGDTLNEIAEECGADLIVMGMKKDRQSRLLGSTTLTAIRKAKVPVLVIPEETVYAPVKHIVFASDFEEVSESSCYNLLFQFTEKFNAGLQLIHVQKKGVEVPASEVLGRIQLGRALANVPFYWYEEVEDNDIDHGIQTFIESHPVDLLVMVAHPHNIFERLLGSIHTRFMSYRTKLPLLVLKDKA